MKYSSDGIIEFENFGKKETFERLPIYENSSITIQIQFKQVK
jgi:hypothetical protein